MHRRRPRCCRRCRSPRPAPVRKGLRPDRADCRSWAAPRAPPTTNSRRPQRRSGDGAAAVVGPVLSCVSHCNRQVHSDPLAGQPLPHLLGSPLTGPRRLSRGAARRGWGVGARCAGGQVGLSQRRPCGFGMVLSIQPGLRPGAGPAGAGIALQAGPTPEPALQFGRARGPVRSDYHAQASFGPQLLGALAASAGSAVLSHSAEVGRQIRATGLPSAIQPVGIQCSLGGVNGFQQGGNTCPLDDG